jgi:hypothetical protein
MAEKTKEILDIEQLNLHKQDYSKLLLIIGIVGLVICLVIAFVEIAEVVSTGLEWIYWIMLGLMCLSGPYGFYMSCSTRRPKRSRPDCRTSSVTWPRRVVSA